MKRLVAFILITTSYLLLSTAVFAQYGQYGPYGGEEPSVSIMVDKMVGKPVLTKGGFVDQDYVDNLSPSDPRFAPEQEIFFKIKVKNTSDLKIKNVIVKDFLPDFVDFKEGTGEFDKATRTLTIDDAGDFEVDEEKLFFIKVKVVEQDELPADQGIVCVVNKAQAFDGGVSDEDTAQFCVEKEVLGVTAVPSAGPEMGALLLSGELLALSTGMLFKRLSRS
ncbi:hypothetical protein HY612_03060 [Candidatus Roizmanbacteria bacterium]|nr:hypothetical protein [Candidatus Roizmanbacteria bacterium]